MNLEPSDRQKQLATDVDAFCMDAGGTSSSLLSNARTDPGPALAAIAERGWLTSDDLTDGCIVVEGVSRADAALGACVATQWFSVLSPMGRWGGHERLAAAAKGAELGCCALSHEGDAAASDAWSPSGLGVTFEEGDGESAVLSGAVRHVDGLTQAQFALVPAKNSEGDSASLFVVDLAASGVEVKGHGDAFGGAGAGSGDLRLEGVRVEASDRLAGTAAEPDWLEHLVGLSSLGAASVAVGVGQAGFASTLGAAMSRPDGPESSPQSTQFYVADISTEVDGARLLCWKAAWSLAHRRRAGLEASQAKLFATEAAQRATDLALQVAGADGYRKGSQVESQFRDARSLEVFSGAREGHKRAIARRIVDES